MLRSKEQLASLPLATMRSAVTMPLCPVRTRTLSPVVICHKRTELSAAALASIAPPTCSRQLTYARWPTNVRTHSPLSTFHKRTVQSSEPLASVRSLGIHLTMRTEAVWPVRTEGRETIAPPLVKFHKRMV